MKSERRKRREGGRLLLVVWAPLKVYMINASMHSMRCERHLSLMIMDTVLTDKEDDPYTPHVHRLDIDR